MNSLREHLLKQLGSKCSRDGYNKDTRILKLRTPISRKGKGDSTYWSEAIELFESNPDGFEIICPNCLEIERLNKRQFKFNQPKLSQLPTKAIVWSGEGFGSTSAWADIQSKDLPVYFVQGEKFYLYPHWDKSLGNVDYLARWFNVDPSTLTDTDECVTLEKI